MKCLNRKIHLVFIISLFLMTTGCAGVRTVDTSKVDTISLAQLMTQPDLMNNLSEKIKNQGGAIIRLSQGDVIPLKMNLDLPFATVESSADQLVVTRDLYIYLSQTQMLFSPDGQRWISIEDWRTRTAKDLFGYKEGRLSIGFKAEEDAGTCLELIIQTIR